MIHAQVRVSRRLRLASASSVLVAEVNPYHISDDMRWMEERIGTERSRGAYAFRTLKNAGAVLVFGSDSPGHECRPLLPESGLRSVRRGHRARRSTASRAAAGSPGERLTIEEAIEAATKNPAWASFEEHHQRHDHGRQASRPRRVRHEPGRGGQDRTGAAAQGACVVHDRRRQGRVPNGGSSNVARHTSITR